MFLDVYKLFKKLLTKSSKNSYLSKCFEISFKGRWNTLFLIWMGECQGEFWEWMIQSMKSYGLSFFVNLSNFGSIWKFSVIFDQFDKFWVHSTHFRSNRKISGIFIQFDIFWVNLKISGILGRFDKFKDTFKISCIFSQFEKFLVYQKTFNLTNLSQFDKFWVNLTKFESI